MLNLFKEELSQCLLIELQFFEFNGDRMSFDFFLFLLPDFYKERVFEAILQRYSEIGIED